MSANICNYTPITSLSMRDLNNRFSSIHRYLCYVSGNLGGSSTLQTLTDASTTVWDYSLGNSANWTITGNNTLSFTNMPLGVSFGVLKMTEGGSGGFIPILPGNSQDVILRLAANSVNLLGFYYDGTSFYWSSSYSGVTTSTTSSTTTTSTTGVPSQTITWSQLQNATNVAGGTLLATGNLDQGGTSTTHLTRVDGKYVQMVVPPTATDSDAAALAICQNDDANYTWGSAGNIVLAAVYQYQGNVSALSGATNGGGDQNLHAASAGDILRIEVSGNDALIKYSSNGGSSFSVIHTYTGVLTGITTIYVKGIVAVAGTGKIYQATGFGLL